MTVLAVTPLALTGCQSPKDLPSPPASSDAADLPPAIAPKPPAFQTQAQTADRYMVSAAHPVAARIGRNVLASGGSAVDAAIAVQAALTLVEPQSSGIGGGAFMLHYDAESGDITAYDGRETAPQNATPALFLDESGEPLPFWEAVIGGRAVGTPGVLRMLDQAHKAHGETPWAALFQPAIKRARGGFKVTPRLHRLISEDESLRADPTARAYFYNEDGAPVAVGKRLRNPALAETLQTVAESGADAFYDGAIAQAIVDKVRRHPSNPGKLSLADFKAYEAKAREPVCQPYRQHKVCGMPPPTSGGVTVAQILGILRAFDMGATQPMSLTAIHRLAEASRLAFADRNTFLADSDFVDVPVKKLLAADYLKRRAGLIHNDRSLGKAEPGLPRQTARMPDQDGGLSTTHFSIVDAKGNVVSMTSSVEQAFGSHLMVRGFMLNNQLTDFSFQPSVAGQAVANRVQPGKRPRSSMSPTLILDGAGHVRHALGSPGGSRIIGYTVQRVIALLDWNLDMQQAINLPNVVNRNGATELERPWRTPFNAAWLSGDPDGSDLVAALRRRGHAIERGTMTSGLHGITIHSDGTVAGGADPRREGMALGD